MTRPAVARILLVITLIVTAHAIKPFSFKNVSSHLLFSSRSLAFVLPDSARSRFDHANQLAMTFSNSLFENGQADTSWPSQPAAGAVEMAVVAMNVSPQTDNKAKPVIVKVKAAINPQAPVHRDKNEQEGLIGSTEETEEAEAAESTDEIASTDVVADSATEPAPVALPAMHSFSAETPVALPAVNVVCALSKVKPIRLELPLMRGRQIQLMYQFSLPKRSDCEKRDSKQIKLIALIEDEKKLKSDSLKLDKSIISILECEDEGTEVVTEEESATGPLEYATQVQDAEPFIIPANPRQTDSCSMQPEE